ncbi:MAG: hypothetical protein ACFE92_15000 [Promethearchaeota archaeon]
MIKNKNKKIEKRNIIFCKRCGVEIPEISEEEIKEDFKEYNKFIQKMALKSIKTNLCPECSSKKTRRWLLFSCVLLFLLGIFYIIMFMFSLLDIFYLFPGIILISLSIFGYYFYVKKKILKLG